MTAHLSSLSDWLVYIAERNWQTVDMRLDRITQMIERMGLTKPAPYVITVAGTNGKGTTCYACEALLLAHGVSVGTAISPHIDCFNERIRLNGANATDEEIVEAFTAVEAQRDGLPLTYFEYSVIASFWLFVRNRVDVAVLEIGLGGRLDGFNVIDADCGVITSIGLDHQAFLGDDLEQIGGEKAGILRAGQRVVLGQYMTQSIDDRCVELGVEKYRYGEDFMAEVSKAEVSKAEVSKMKVSKDNWCLDSPFINLSDLPITDLAPHNLAVACMAVGCYRPLDAQKIRTTFAGLSARGRMEHRLWRDRQLILDVAHNPAGVEFLFQQLAMRNIRPDVLCCAMLKDKEHAQVYNVIAPYFQGRWLFIDSLGDRACTAEEVNHAMGNPGCVRANTDLETFLSSETKAGDVILGFGSFSLVEQLLIGVPGRA